MQKNMIKDKIPFDIMIILLWLFVWLIIILSDKNGMVRVILGIPIVLFIPGYILTCIISPKRDLGWIERIAMSLAMSLVAVSIIGIILNFTIGLYLNSIIASLYIFIGAMVPITIYIRGKIRPDDIFSVSLDVAYKNINDIFSANNVKDGILTGILILSIIVFVGVSYFAVVTPKIGERFTEFYILSNTGDDDHLTNLNINNSYDYLLGITNHEYRKVNYTIKVVLNNNVLASEDLVLNHDDTWENNVTFSPYYEGKDMKFEFWLYKDHNFTEPYRELHLWVNAI